MKTITQHMKLNQKQRQAHIDLSSPCIRQKNINNKRYGSTQAKNELIKYHNIEKFDGRIEKVHTCHKCLNSSAAPNGFVCVNPEHLYFGTISENHMDKTPEQRKAGAKTQLKNGNHISKNKEACAKGYKTQLKNGNHPSQNKEACAKNCKKAVKAAIKNGNHMNQQKLTCPHCGHTSNPGVMAQWHFDKCKHKV